MLTDRSDTMDSLAVALALLAAVALVAAARAEERDAAAGRWLLAGAGAAVGAAFAVKLFQALIPVPALAVLYVAASPLALGERLSRLVLCGAVALAVGLSWFAVVSTAPGREQPWAYGSHDGTALSAAFAYDGLDRLAGPERRRGAEWRGVRARASARGGAARRARAAGRRRGARERAARQAAARRRAVAARAATTARLRRRPPGRRGSCPRGPTCAGCSGSSCCPRS